MSELESELESESESESDFMDESEDEEAGPIATQDIKIIQQFKDIVQVVKSKIYEKNIITDTVPPEYHTNPYETDNSELNELHKYEIIMMSIGTNLLQGLWDIENAKMLDITPVILWKIVIDDNLSSDSKILIENEIRSQFIQHPVSRITSNNIE
jgi:hypothetical protein